MSPEPKAAAAAGGRKNLTALFLVLQVRAYCLHILQNRKCLERRFALSWVAGWLAVFISNSITWTASVAAGY